MDKDITLTVRSFKDTDIATFTVMIEKDMDMLGSDVIEWISEELKNCKGIFDSYQIACISGMLMRTSIIARYMSKDNWMRSALHLKMKSSDMGKPQDDRLSMFKEMT